MAVCTRTVWNRPELTLCCRAEAAAANALLAAVEAMSGLVVEFEELLLLLLLLPLPFDAPPDDNDDEGAVTAGTVVVTMIFTYTKQWREQYVQNTNQRADHILNIQLLRAPTKDEMRFDLSILSSSEKREEKIIKTNTIYFILN